MSAIDQSDSHGEENIDEISQNDGVPKGTEPPCSSEESNRDSLTSDEFEKLDFDQIPHLDDKETTPEDITDTGKFEKEEISQTNNSKLNYDSYLQNEANLLDDPNDETADHITKGSYQLQGDEEETDKNTLAQDATSKHGTEDDKKFGNASSDSGEESSDSSSDDNEISDHEIISKPVKYETQSLVSKVTTEEKSTTIKESQHYESISITTQSSNLTTTSVDLTPPSEDSEIFDNSFQKITTQNSDSELLSSQPKDSSQTGGFVGKVGEEILMSIPIDVSPLSADILSTLESSPVEITPPQIEAPVSSIESMVMPEELIEIPMEKPTKEELPSEPSPILEMAEMPPQLATDFPAEINPPVVEKESSGETLFQIPADFDKSPQIGKQFEDILGLTKPRSIIRRDERPTLKWSSFSPLMNLVYWRDVKKSGAVFGVIMVILISLLYASFISVVAYSSLALLAGTISFTLYKNVMNAVQKSQDGHPFKEFLDFDTNLSSEKAHELTDLTISKLNSYVSLVKRLFLVEDLLDSVKFGCLLWCLTCVGSWFNGLTLVILAVVALFTLPKVYEQNQSLVDQYIELVSGQVNMVMGKVRAAIPIGGGNKDKDKEQ